MQCEDSSQRRGQESGDGDEEREEKMRTVPGSTVRGVNRGNEE